MRILRLFAPSLIGDHTLCYVHCNSSGLSCINEVPADITYVCAGEDISTEFYSDKMTIVLPPGTSLEDGDFLAAAGGEPLLRWKSSERRFVVFTSGFLSVSSRVCIWKTIRTAVLTISDKGSKGERIDTAGPELERLITAQGGEVGDRKIVPDEKEAIAESVRSWCDDGYALILTTGGTGLSPRDVTPEALIGIAEKTVPGFGEMMRMKTLQYTDRAFLTRGIAVIRGKTLIIAFPGSQRGARQCFEAVAPALRHGVETLSGWDSECGSHPLRH